MEKGDDEEVTLRRRIVEERLKNLGFEIKPESNEPNSVPSKKPDSPYSISSILWFIAAIGMFYLTDFASVVLYDNRINRLWFNIGLAFGSVFVAIACFVIVYLTYYRKIKPEDWDSYNPALIPIATACFAVTSICLNVGLWPVWSFLTPVILFVLFMGFIVMTAAIPGS